ncbi:MAG: DUF192 domain-containing protein [Anaerovibrio sp.]|uniref:DUF192 domain-containing protein n=1 Tax=Anaerovibrio sp. RM50 TaxID=1200557 RepID=UPI000688401B|nr:DUF192 domain-containing protein [Anaerovibrio sp. RM50]MBQ1855861.1 DUF192 domain-containing protein [Anaerovibrio sp.]
MVKLTLNCAPDEKFKIQVADNFLKRFLGLMGRFRLDPNTGILLTPCNSIHMMFMRFPIDVIFYDDDYKVVKIATNLKPWTGICVAPGAKGVIELPAGTLSRIPAKKLTDIKIEPES